METSAVALPTVNKSLQSKIFVLLSLPLLASGVALGWAMWHHSWIASVVLPLGLVLGGLLASWFILGRILQPLHAITTAARRIVAGEMSHRLVVQSQDEIGVLVSLTNHLTTSLAQLTETQAQRTGVLAVLHSMSTAINATLGRQPDFVPVLEAIRRFGTYDHVHFFRVDPERQALLSAAAAGTVTSLASLPDVYLSLEDERELHVQVTRLGKAILAHDAQLSTEDVSYVQGSDVSLRSLLVVPVHAEGQVYGVLSVAQLAPHRRLNASDQRFMMTCANHLAPALAQAQARREVSQLQTALQQQREALETDLEQQRQALEQTQASAVATGSTASRFLANISHEIRTPMNGVIGMVDLLLGTSLTVKQRRFADTIRRSGEALLLLINDILDFAKIEAGKLELESTDFDIRQTTEDVVELLAESAYQKGLELICDVQPTIPSALRGDPLRLRQILTNLIGNAIKFTSQGEVIVRITKVEDGHRHITLRCDVQDTGIGIPPDVQRQIFDAFSQADDSTTRHYGGTGLGLAITKQLVEMMHGTLQVDSQAGEGATFWFTVRFDLQPAQLHLSRAMPLGLQGLEVLIVDDNHTVSAALERQLQALCVSSHQASTSAQALSMMRTAQSNACPYDLIIIDMQLPDMDGTELAVTLRTEANLQRLPLILMTPLGHYERDIRLSGAVEYLAKPIRRSQLYTCLMSVMSASGTIPLPEDLLLIHAREHTMTFHGHVLIAEDNAVNQEVAREMFTSLGCQIDLANNGEEAVKMASTTNYDLIFMDCQMPVMDGFEATRALRLSETLQQQQRTPIIALTAHAAEGDRKQCLAIGMDDYLSKPFNQAGLASILRRWLPRYRVEPARDTTPAEPHLTANASPAEPQPSDIAASQAVAHSAVEPIDLKVLEALRTLPRGPAALERILRTYLQTTPALVTTLREAINQGDASTVYKTAHSLTGSCGHVGALALAALCKELEDLGRSPSLTTAGSVMERLEAEYAIVCAALERELPQAAA